MEDHSFTFIYLYSLCCCNDCKHCHLGVASQFICFAFDTVLDNMRIQLIVLCLSAFFDLSMATNTSSNHNESTTTKDPQEDRNMNINQEESILYRQLRSDRGREQRRHKQNYKKTYKREQDNDGDDGDYKMKIKNKKKNKKCGRNANGYVEQYPSRTDIEDVRFSKGMY